MLVVKVEIWPGGNPLCPVTIGNMFLANISDLADVSDYDVLVEQASNDRLGIPFKSENFEVEGHKRSDSAFRLIHTALGQYLEK